MNMKQGRYIITNTNYKVFEPSKLPVEIDLLKISKELELANRAIGALNFLDIVLPNYELLVEPYITKEALLSSEIEGTQSTLSAVLNENKEVSDNIDIREVQNYKKALNYALNSELPLCNRLLKETHKVLMLNVRGGESHKTPGEFRTSQNWIGGTSPSNSIYNPPTPENMIECMSDLEKYINSDDSLPSLVQTALIHYQFETIHPFLDGNGRIGRILITLFLSKNKILKQPNLFLSLYLKENKEQYYNLLTKIRETGNYENWLIFFLNGIINISERMQKTSNKIIELKEKFKKETRDKYNFVDFIFKKPTFIINDIIKEMQVNYNIADYIAKDFEKKNIIKEITNYKRNKRYCFVDYLKILEEI
ncbi:MAG: Fic family protein [Rickettsiales bacterium]|nr:MAG: Fic family protein [Rickettsiales bacterium]